MNLPKGLHFVRAKLHVWRNTTNRLSPTKRVAWYNVRKSICNQTLEEIHVTDLFLAGFLLKNNADFIGMRRRSPKSMQQVWRFKNNAKLTYLIEEFPRSEDGHYAMFIHEAKKLLSKAVHHESQETRVAYS